MWGELIAAYDKCLVVGYPRRYAEMKILRLYCRILIKRLLIK